MSSVYVYLQIKCIISTYKNILIVVLVITYYWLENVEYLI